MKDKKKELNFDITNKEVFSRAEDVNDEIERISGDDNIIVDLFRDENIQEELMEKILDTHADAISEKATNLLKLIILGNVLVRECIEDIVKNGYDLDSDEVEEYRKQFTQSRISSYILRNENIGFDEEDIKEQTRESILTFNTIVNMILLELKEEIKNKE